MDIRKLPEPAIRFIMPKIKKGIDTRQIIFKRHTSTLSDEIVKRLITDIRARAGVQKIWDGFSHDTREEVKQEWYDIVFEELNK